MGKFRGEPDSRGLSDRRRLHQTFARSGELVVFANDRPEGYADNRGARHAHRRSRRRRAGAGRRHRRHLRAMARYRRHLQSHGWRPGHRRLRPRRLGDPALHAAGAGPRARRRRGRQYPPACCRSLSRSGFSSSRFRPGAGRASSSPRTMEPTATLWRPRWLLEWGPRVLAFLPFVAAASRAPGQFQVERARRLALAGDRRDLSRAASSPDERDNEASRGRYADGAVGSGHVGHRRPRHGVRRDGCRDPLARRNRRRAWRPGDRVLRARLHHSRDHDRLPARHEPQDPGYRARSSCGRSCSGCSSTITGSGGAP